MLAKSRIEFEPAPSIDPNEIASPQAFMWAPAAIWNRDRATAFLLYFHYLGSSEFKENCARLLISNATDLSVWHP
jgi:hypothetical protein